LQTLDEEAVNDYVSARWSGLTASKTLARVIHERTDGNPLFVVSVADYLAAEGVVADSGGQCVLTKDIGDVHLGVPQGLRPMIHTQIDRLGDADRELLEASSVAGRTFSAALVASALDTGVVDVEARLERLARRGQLVRATGEAMWPDGTVAGRYELIHSLHQHELMERVPPARRRLLHARIATRLETGYGRRALEIASELAYHFEAAGQSERAVPYLEEAATRAVRRGASAEAGVLFQRALAMLDALPPNPERILRTIRLCMAYAIATQVRLGPAPELEAVCERARVLSEETDDLPQLFQALAILFTLYLMRARYRDAHKVADEIAALAPRLVFPGFVSMGHALAGIVTFHTGDLTEAQQHLAKAQNLEEISQPVNPLTLTTQIYNYESLTLMHLGYPDRARAHYHASTVHAAASGTPFDRAQSAMIACYLNIFVRDMETLLRSADDAKRLGEDFGYAMVLAISMLGRGRVLVAHGEYAAGIAMMQDGLDLYRTRHQAIGLPTIMAAFADAQCEAGNFDQGLVLVAEARALVEATGEVRSQAELQRLEGELRERRNEPAAAERCYRNAIETAHGQNARWWELRASVSLARLQQQQQKRAAARRLLEPIVSSFTEGFDTPDVRAAHALLRTLA
jgi:tetratricopeptide (TPR) repeat protein